jgi:hypothetical protein
MIQIGSTIVSFDVIEKKFTCDLNKCKGTCCIEGDSGAPLEEDEISIIEKNYEKFKPYMRSECIDSVNKQGVWVTDNDGDKVTPLLDGKECVYVYFDNNIAFCAIEKAYNLKLINWPKPISCHLYPIRIKNFQDFDAVNYHKWDVCKHAIIKGVKNNTKVYEFLKAPLERKFGSDWYKELTLASQLLNNS